MLLRCAEALGDWVHPQTTLRENLLRTFLVSTWHCLCVSDGGKVLLPGSPQGLPLCQLLFYAFKIHLFHFYVIVGLKEKTLSTNHWPVGRNPSITLDAAFQ